MLASVAEAIGRNGGRIPLARHMGPAPRAPRGHHAGGAPKLGPDGDFVTAPELGSLFGRTLARQLKAFPKILEIGAGSGALADVLLKEIDCEYWILETSPSLRALQQQRLGTRARWL